MENMTLAEYIEQRTPICTPYEHIQHLIAASTYVSKNGKAATPDVHELALGECIGGRTIMVGDDKWMFSMDKNLIMESPDELFDKFPRIDYDFQLFMGDDKGFLICKAQGTLTHADMVKRLWKAGDLVKGMFGYDIVNVPPWCRKVGNPERMDVFHSGTILPKQDGVDGTYVAFWKNVGYANLRHHVKNYCVKNFEGPYFAEIPIDDEAAFMTFKPTEF